MRFGVLGPVQVEAGDVRITLPSTQLRVLLAALLAEPNATVPAARLEFALWGERPPASARASLHNQMLRLRRQLGPEAGARIRTVAPGYLIEVHEGELDEQLFADGCARGHQALEAGRWADATRELTAALELWRGEPGSDLPAGAVGAVRAHWLAETRLQALRGRVEAALSQGRHQEVAAEIKALTEEYPLFEAFHGQLMLALYRGGRQGEALAAFQNLRRILVDQLAVEPSPPLRDLHRRILTGDPELAPPTATAVLKAGGPESAETGTDPISARHQLPTDTRVFTGRLPELEELLALAARAPQGTESGMVVVSAVDGMAGVGKTALAVHAAHLLRPSFPDGQLFLDLRGHTPGVTPLTPGDALDFFLRSLGAAPQQIPQDLLERAAAYRDRLAGTRTLIVLDNAAGAAQVRPLLPGTPGCLVLITSRRRLTGLDDARLLALDVLPEAEAVALLRRAAGSDRIPPDHPAAAELALLCGYVPLVIRIVAARLRNRRSLRIEDLVDQLRDDESRLVGLRDEEADLETVFDSSYQSLAPAEQHLFRRLGQAPGLDLDAYAAANLIGSDHRTAERLLETLLDHSLLAEPRPGRYQLHDLLRVYARSLGDQDPATDRAAALNRLLDYYEDAARRADRQLTRYTRPRLSPQDPDPKRSALPAPPGLPALIPRDRAEALTWLRAERANLLAALAHPAAQNSLERLTALTEAIGGLLRVDGPWPLAVTLHRTAADRAAAAGDAFREANALYDLSQVPNLLGEERNHTTVAVLSERVLTLYREAGSRLGEGNALSQLGNIHTLMGRYRTAIAWYGQAAEIFRELDDLPGEALVEDWLIHLGLQHGDLNLASTARERAVELHRALGDKESDIYLLHDLAMIRFATGNLPDAARLLEQVVAERAESASGASRASRADAFQDLARIRCAMGEYAVAEDLHARAIELYRAMQYELNSAHALCGLAAVRLATGDPASATNLATSALTIFRGFGSHAGEGHALLTLGRSKQATGNLPAALDLVREALTLQRTQSRRPDEAEALNALGSLLRATGDLQEAETTYRTALALSREIGARLDEARALEGLAHCTALTATPATALPHLRAALTLYRACAAAETAAAEAWLAQLGSTGRPTL